MTEQNYKIRFKSGLSEIEVEGDKNFVDEKFSFLLKEIKANPSQMPVEATIQPKAVDIGTVVPATTGQKINIKEFVSNKKPHGSLEIAVVLAYYLSKFEGKETIIDEDLKKIWIASGCKPSKNLPQAMIDCKSKHGWFESVSRGTYKINEHGIYLVETELPRK